MAIFKQNTTEICYCLLREEAGKPGVNYICLDVESESFVHRLPNFPTCDVTSTKLIYMSKHTFSISTGTESKQNLRSETLIKILARTQAYKHARANAHALGLFAYKV